MGVMHVIGGVVMHMEANWLNIGFRNGDRLEMCSRAQQTCAKAWRSQTGCQWVGYKSHTIVLLVMTKETGTKVKMQRDIRKKTCKKYDFP